MAEERLNVPPAESQWLDAFDECLNRLKAGESISACLARYPDLAADLGPMLEAAHIALVASRVPHHAQMRSRARFLTAAGSLRVTPGTRALGFLRRALTTTITLAVGFLLGTTGLYYASASTLPGDGLYPIKRTFEGVQLQFASGPAARATLEDEFTERRQSEAEELLNEGRTAGVEFSGIVVSQSPSVWQIGVLNVRVTNATAIEGDPKVGVYVLVILQVNEDSLTAITIASRETERIGELARRGELWAIGDVQFSIVPDTIVSGTPSAGATAVARLRTLSTGDIVAVSLTILAPPTATPSGAGSATFTPLTSPTLAPTRTPAPTQTVPLTESREATHTLDASETDEPDETPEPSETDEPSKTPRPSETREPTKTHEPSNTPGGGNSGSGGGSGGGGSGSGGGDDDDGDDDGGGDDGGGGGDD